MNQEATLRASITALVAALRSGENINSKRNAFINAGKAYVTMVKANATPVAAATPGAVNATVVSKAIPPAINAVNKLTTASGGTSIKNAVLSALRGIKLLIPKARPATSTPVNNTRITTLIGNRWGEKSDLLKKYIAESYLLKNGKSNMKGQTANRAIGKKSLLGRYNDPKLREFWGMVDAKMKIAEANARLIAKAQANANAAAKARTNAATKAQANARIRVDIMGANQFNTITNRNAAITAYIKDRPANKKAANRKALAGRFGFRTVDPNLIKFFAAVNERTAANKKIVNTAAAQTAREAKAVREAAAQTEREAKAVRDAAAKAARAAEKQIQVQEAAKKAANKKIVNNAAAKAAQEAKAVREAAAQTAREEKAARDAAAKAARAAEKAAEKEAARSTALVAQAAQP